MRTVTAALPLCKHHPSMLLAATFVALSVSLHSVLMLWVVLLSLCAFGVRLGFYFGFQHHPIALRQINLLAVLSILALGWFGVSIGLLNSMLNLLVIACALKLLQLRSQKDFLQLVSACFFLVGCGFIFNATLWAWIGYTLLCVGLLLCLRMLFVPSQPLVRGLKHIGVLVLQASPIALLLFMVIPQFPPLWQMPTSKSQQTGLSDSVTPGDIASLAQSSALAFTATFDTSPPARTTRYWRAMTMEDFDGKTWSVSAKRLQAERQLSRLGRNISFENTRSLAYQVIIEPTHQPYIYALELSSLNNAARSGGRVQFDHAIRAFKPITSKKAIELSYHQGARLDSPLIGFDSQLNLLYPKNSNPKTEAWVAKLRSQYGQDSALIAHIMRYFASQKFTYTLTPNPMPTAPVDAFLFTEQAGFCAHYASAMAFALRVAGIPSRLVTGYQGGETLTENVLQLRQYDAHAWVEALIDGTWVRYDPTSMVAPTRMSRGLADALDALGQEREGDMFTAMQKSALYNSIQSMLRQLDYQWSRWVLGFDNKNQKDILMKLLGKLTPSKVSAFFIAVLTLIAFMLLLYFYPLKRAKRLPKEKAIYLRAVNRIENHTHSYRETLPADAYYQQVADKLPVVARAHFKQITEAFQTLHYAPEVSHRQQLIAQMNTQLTQLKRALR